MRGDRYLPDSFEVHWSDFDYMLEFLALENAVSSSAGHACYVEELGTIDHMVICLCQNLMYASFFIGTYLHVEQRMYP